MITDTQAVASILHRHGFGKEGADLVYDPKKDACAILLKLAHRHLSVPRECMIAMCELIVSRERPAEASAKTAPFFMVYREGGRSPTFKHPDMASASKEAQRICKESGETTHVLGVVETYRAHGRPTIEEVIEHGRQYPYGDNDVGWGLWRVVRDKEFPRIVAVRSGSGATTPYISYDSDWRPGCHVENVPEDYRWFPLDATGKDVEEDIPMTFPKTF